MFLVAHFRQINNNSKFLVCTLPISTPLVVRKILIESEGSVGHAHVSIHAKLHQRTQASDFVCTFQITAHTHTPSRLKKPSDEWEKESERVKVWQGRKISKWVQNMHFHMHKKGSPCVCVCAEGIFHVEPTLWQDTKRENFECVWVGQKTTRIRPHTNFRVHFCAVWMQVDANVQHIRDAAALEKAQENFYLRILKTQKQRSRRARVSEWGGGGTQQKIIKISEKKVHSPMCEMQFLIGEKTWTESHRELKRSRETKIIVNLLTEIRQRSEEFIASVR